MEEIKWYKQSEDDIYNNPVDWSTSYYNIRKKDGTEHLLAVWLDESGDGSRHEHYEFAGEDELVDLDEIELWRPANGNTDVLNKAAQEYSFMIPTQCDADSLWKQETEQHFKDGAIWGKEQAIKKICNQQLSDEKMKELLRTEYEKGRYDVLAEQKLSDSFDIEYNNFCQNNNIKIDDNSYKIAKHFSKWKTLLK